MMISLPETERKNMSIIATKSEKKKLKFVKGTIVRALFFSGLEWESGESRVKYVERYVYVHVQVL